VTCLRRGEIFKHEFVANLLLSLPVKKFENRLIFGDVMGKSLVSCFLTNRSTNRAGFWHECFFSPILHRVIKKF